MKRGKFEPVRNLIRRTLPSRWAVALCATLALPALASGGGHKGAADGINYIPITPPLVVNYGGPGKSRYIKAELSSRSENAADANTVTHHLPLIRDKLVSILSAQTDEIVSSAEGKEYLRTYALAEINKALLQVQGLATAETSATTSATASTTPAAEPAPTVTTTATTTATTLPTVTPVKGPASDLYFNNFVVQK